MDKQHIVFLTGAGISAESGLSTFRGKDGMWTNEEWVYLASTEALHNDTQRLFDEKSNQMREGISFDHTYQSR